MDKEFRPRLNETQNNVIESMKGRRSVKSYIMMGCNHVPFHNQPLTKGVLDLMSAYKYDGIMLLGDFLDMGALSQYEKGKISHTNVTLKEEYEVGNELLDMIDERLDKNALKVFIYGNHCDRYWRWMADVNNNKLGDVFSPTDQLRLKDRGYIVKDNYKTDYYKLAALYVMHGEYYNIHAAKKHLDVFRRNTIFVHTHRVQIHREGDFCAWNSGLMAEIDAPCFDYAPRGMRMQWANAFSIVHIDENENHFVELINCVNNSFVYNGVKYGE